MPEIASAGVRAVPSPLPFEVYDTDLERAREAYWRGRVGIRKIPAFVIGIVFLLLTVLNFIGHRVDWWITLLTGCAFIALSLRPDPNEPPLLRPIELRFGDDGIDVDVAYAQPPSRHYAWNKLRAIEDIGEALVLIPTFGTRVVFPKRNFPDGGSEALSFFAAHGIAGPRSGG
jgi:hypothetical protein